MTVLELITDLFDRAEIVYTKIEHHPVYTSEEAAKIRDTSMDMGAKALVWFADNKPILIVVPGDKKLNTKKFKNTFGVKDLRFATPDEVFELTSLKIGSIPPVGKALGLKSYYDSSLRYKEYVAFNAGSHTVSIKMRASDLISVEQPELGQIV